MAHLPDAPLPHALEAFAAPDLALPDEAGAAITCEMHEQAVPPFVETALDRLYGSLYASWRHLKWCAAVQTLPHAWVAYRRGEIAAALLFRVQAERVLVLNEMMSIDGSLIDAFCRSVFSRYPQVRLITLNAVDVDRWSSRWPSQSFVFSENYVIDLPASVEAYRTQLGKSTRKTLNGYGNRIARELPGLRWEGIDATSLSFSAQRSLVRTLQRFKRDGMQARGKQAAIDRHDTARLLLMARDCGLYGMATMDGRVVAGSLACRIGDSYVMLLSAADPRLAPWRLGFLACYWAICDCIARQGRCCHLLWGRYDYKQQLLGQLRLIRRLHLYRSRGVMLLHPRPIVSLGWQMSCHYGRQYFVKYSRRAIKFLNKFL